MLRTGHGVGQWSMEESYCLEQDTHIMQHHVLAYQCTYIAYSLMCVCVTVALICVQDCDECVE